MASVLPTRPHFVVISAPFISLVWWTTSGRSTIFCLGIGHPLHERLGVQLGEVTDTLTCLPAVLVPRLHDSEHEVLELLWLACHERTTMVYVVEQRHDELALLVVVDGHLDAPTEVDGLEADRVLAHSTPPQWPVYSVPVGP